MMVIQEYKLRLPRLAPASPNNYSKWLDLMESLNHYLEAYNANPTPELYAVVRWFDEYAALELGRYSTWFSKQENTAHNTAAKRLSRCMSASSFYSLEDADVAVDCHLDDLLDAVQTTDFT